MKLLANLFAVIYASLAMAAFAADNPDSEATDGRKQTQKEEQAQKKDRATAEQATVLPEMTVTASPVDETSYNVLNATTATKTDTPIMETPLSIQVIPQQVLKDQQAYRLDKALWNVSGVFSDPNSAGGGTNETTNIRGFETSDTYRNGLRFNGVSNATGPVETANLERIEVLKGPASILYGRIEPGGLINLVPKEPLAQPYYSLEQQFGSFSFYRTMADATGRITKDDTLLYRLNLAYENADSFQDFRENERVFVAPVLRWNIGPRTQVTFELEYKDARDPVDFGIPAVGNRPAAVPRSFNPNEPGSANDSENLLAGFHWSHTFNDDWSLRHNFYWNRARDVFNGILFFALETTPDNRILLDRAIVPPGAFGKDTYSTALDLTGKFETWGLAHTLLLGGDYYDYINNQPISRNPIFLFTPIDLFHPVHGGSQQSVVLQDDSGEGSQDWYGLYLQDQVTLPYGFHLLAGFRYDHATQRSTRTDFLQDPVATTESRAEDEAVTPRFGLLWQPIPALSLYGNYVENFGLPNLTGVNAPGGASTPPLQPETAQQWEVGLKTELLDGRLTGTLAWYDITKQNIPATDPLNLFRTILVGEARNRGLEMDIAGEILPGWRMIAAGSYIDSEITKDSQPDFTNVDGEGNPLSTTPGNTGHRLFNVPKFSGSVWTTYEWQQGSLKGFKLGGGMLARSQREGDNENTFQLPGYAIVNLMAGYQLTAGPSKVSLQFNIENLLDKDYFYSSTGGREFGGSHFGTPRTFLGSVRVEF